MKYIFLTLVLLISACSDKPDLPIVLLRIDSTFSQMARDSGMQKAFKRYAVSEVTKFSLDKMLPNYLMTKDSINKGKTMLFWLPLKANISKDGNLGWTAGTWFFVIKLANGFDTVKTGSYVTFWEKQDDGTWKYIVDKGNLSPDDFK